MFIRRVKNYLMDVKHLRKDDVILAAYPKTGSTWVRFMLCNLISLNEWNGKIVDFETLNDTLISFGQGRLTQEWPYRSLPAWWSPTGITTGLCSGTGKRYCCSGIRGTP